MNAYGLALIAVVGLLGGVALHDVKKQEPTPIEIQSLVDVVLNDKLNSLPGYDTLEEAGVQASQRAANCSHYYECGGIIALRPSDHKYVVGPVQSSRSGDSVHFERNAPLGWKVVANYHSHPCLPDTHYVDFFSPEDLMGDTMNKEPGFMVNLCTGDVHEFDPSRDSPNDTLVGDEGIYSTHGRTVGNIGKSPSVEPSLGTP